MKTVCARNTSSGKAGISAKRRMTPSFFTIPLCSQTWKTAGRPSAPWVPRTSHKSSGDKNMANTCQPRPHLATKGRAAFVSATLRALTSAPAVSLLPERGSGSYSSQPLSLLSSRRRAPCSRAKQRRRYQRTSQHRQHSVSMSLH